MDDTRVTGMKRMNTDDAALAVLGYKQEFKREFSMIETFGLSFSIIGLVPSIASVIIYAIPNGGTVAMVWGWLVACFFIMTIAFALAELGSAAPTAGGLYYWTHQYSSPRYKNVMSWMVGYVNTISIIVGVTSVDYACAIMIFAAVSIADDTFVATIHQIFGLFTALIFTHVLIVCLATRVLARLQNAFMALNILLIIAIIIAIPAVTPKAFHNNASFAFGNFINSYGWPNGYAFVLSFLAPLWAVGGFDSSLHISEEAINANRVVPFTMITAPALGCLLGWVINTVIVFFVGTDLEGVVSNSIGQPFATILFNSFGQKGSLAVWSLVIISQYVIGACLLIASSRQTFAFARDGALPLSGYIYSINKYTQTPVNGVIFDGFVAWCFGLLTLAGVQAATALFSLSVCGQYVAYSIPIAARFLGENDFEAGPFSLGRLSAPISFIAVAWMTFIVIVLLFPTSHQTNATSMNYTVVVLGGWIILSLVGYYFPIYGGVNWFTGPRVTLDEKELDTSRERGGTVESLKKIFSNSESQTANATRALDKLK